MSYGGLICKIKLSEHPNADNLAIGNCSGYQVIVSKDVQDETLGVFFMTDTQLGHDFCIQNNLYRKHPENKKILKGYLESNRRVRTIKLRGEESEGLWLPITCFTKLVTRTFKCGEEINELNDRVVAKKYVTPATKRKMVASLCKGTEKAYNFFPDFHKHYDTPQLRNNLGRIPAGALLTFTEKLHGTSGRSGHLPCVQPRTWLDRLLCRPGKTEWKHVMGSRNVVLQEKSLDYKSENIRLKHHRRLSLRRGETVYYEIVGYSEGGAPVMPKCGVEGDDPVKKEIRKRFKPDMNLITFAYGCEPGQSEMYVYRITQISEGYVVELPWHQVVRRCNDLDVKHVPVLTSAIYAHGPSISDENAVNTTKDILDICKAECSLESTLDPSSIKEGVCVRVEHPDRERVFKYKSFWFCHLEGIAKQDEGYIDMEDIS